jgi:hypothetical protein
MGVAQLQRQARVPSYYSQGYGRGIPTRHHTAKVRNLSEPTEKFTDWERFQSTASVNITQTRN